MKHRADAYCVACGGQCREPWLAPPVSDKPLRIRPAFTGAGAPSWRPSRKPGKFE